MQVVQLITRVDAHEGLRRTMADLEDFGLARVQGKKDLEFLKDLFKENIEVIEDQFDGEHLTGWYYLVKLKKTIHVEKKIKRASCENWSYTLVISYDGF